MKGNHTCCITSKHSWYVAVDDVYTSKGTPFHNMIDNFENGGFAIDLLTDSLQWDCYVGHNSKHAMTMFVIQHDCSLLSITKLDSR